MPIVAKLSEANIRYRWLPTGSLQVVLQEKMHRATDLEEGQEFLQTMGISAASVSPKKTSEEEKAWFSSYPFMME